MIFPNNNTLLQIQALPNLKTPPECFLFSASLVGVSAKPTTCVPTKGCSASWVWSLEVQGQQVSPRRIHSSGLSVWGRSTPRIWQLWGLWPASHRSQAIWGAACFWQVFPQCYCRPSGQPECPPEGMECVDSGERSPVPTSLSHSQRRKEKQQRSKQGIHLSADSWEAEVCRSLPDLLCRKAPAYTVPLRSSLWQHSCQKPAKQTKISNWYTLRYRRHYTLNTKKVSTII